MDSYSRRRRNRAIHEDQASGFRGRQNSTIADLSTGFCIKWRAVEDDLMIKHGNDGRRGLERLSAYELSFGQGLINGIDLGLVRTLPACTRTCTLLLHFGLEACVIDSKASLASHFVLLVQCQTVGIVELESDAP